MNPETGTDPWSASAPSGRIFTSCGPADFRAAVSVYQNACAALLLFLGRNTIVNEFAKVLREI